MLGLQLQLRRRRDLQRLHRALNLIRQDLYGPVHPRTASGDRPLEIRAVDRRELRVRCHRRNDVRSVHDAGVDGDFKIVSDLADHLGAAGEMAPARCPC